MRRDPILTDAVRERVISDILSGLYNPGESIPTERDMAALTSTSRVTVRRAYAALEEAGIIERRPGVGTCVATGYAGNEEPMQYVALLSTLNFAYAREFAEAIQSACYKRDVLMILATTEANTAEQREMAVKLASKGVKNIVVWGFDKGLDMSLFERIRVLGVNQVFFDRVIPGPFADFVGLDNKAALSALVGTAADAGCKELVFIDSTQLRADSHRERKEGFVTECRKRAIGFEFLDIPWPSGSTEEIRACVSEYLAGRKDREGLGLITANGPMGLLVYGMKPEEMPLYSVDGCDQVVGKGFPCYKQPLQEMADAALDLLNKQRKRGRDWTAGKYRFKGQILNVD